MLVIFTHPLGGKSYAGAMLDATVKGLKNGNGHNVRVRRLYCEPERKQESYMGNHFPALLTASERESYLTDESMAARTSIDGLRRIKTAPEVVAAVEDLKWCDSLILVHPTWWFGFPAVLKGYFDRVLLPGVAFRLPSGSPNERIEGGLVPLLGNIDRISVVTSYGSGFWTASMLDTSRPFVSKVFRGLCDKKCLLHWLALYDMDTQSEASLEAHLKTIQETFEKF